MLAFVLKIVCSKTCKAVPLLSINEFYKRLLLSVLYSNNFSDSGGPLSGAIVSSQCDRSMKKNEAELRAEERETKLYGIVSWGKI